LGGTVRSAGAAGRYSQLAAATARASSRVAPRSRHAGAQGFSQAVSAPDCVADAECSDGGWFWVLWLLAMVAWLVYFSVSSIGVCARADSDAVTCERIAHGRHMCIRGAGAGSIAIFFLQSARKIAGDSLRLQMRALIMLADGGLPLFGAHRLCPVRGLSSLGGVLMGERVDVCPSRAHR
jgi:hypothetical protein